MAMIKEIGMCWCSCHSLYLKKVQRISQPPINSHFATAIKDTQADCTGCRKISKNNWSTRGHLHLPASLVVIAILRVAVCAVVVGLAVLLAICMRLQVQIRVAPGAGVQVLVLQLHVTLAGLCRSHALRTLVS
jgi:hypothetical protein